LPLYWKVCLINGVLFTSAAAVLVVSPATVSSEVTGQELAVLISGLTLILVANAVLLHGTLAPLDRLMQRMHVFDIRKHGERLPEHRSGVAGVLARSFNALLARLETERATSDVRALAAQETERQRVAQELHDEVGQRLTVVLLGLNRALHEAPRELSSELTLVQENVRSSLEELRRVARGLRPGVLEDLGLVSALVAMTNEFVAETGIELRRHLDRELCPLPPEAELVIFRVAQEALTNVTRHAHAQTVDLSLTNDSNGVNLAVVDDGIGIEGSASGAGIRGMRERAVFVGGVLSVRPRGGGTEVKLDIPLDGSADEP